MHIGTPGRPWNDNEKAKWRAQQTKKREYEVVQREIEKLEHDFDVTSYGRLDYAPQSFSLFAVRTRHWNERLPIAVVTGGVHGYETSGVWGTVLFAQRHLTDYIGRVNVLLVPCVSPWAYERIHRWNPLALDPNRSFRAHSPAPESAALWNLLAPIRERVAMHIDLHETTDSDESEFGPALAARDGVPFEPGAIPDGFYLVDDSAAPQPQFQRAIIDKVAKVTHIAPADANGEIIGSPVVAPGVITYALRDLGLCAGITEAKYKTTTEVYPDSPRATPALCNDAQVTAVRAALDYLLI